MTFKPPVYTIHENVESLSPTIRLSQPLPEAFDLTITIVDVNTTGNVYLYIKSRNPLHLSVTLLTCPGLSTSPYQLPNIINPSSSSIKFVTISQSGDQLALYSHLKTKKWRKLEQHSIKNHTHIAQHIFLEFSFDSTVTWHSKHAVKRDLSKIKCRELEYVDC